MIISALVHNGSPIIEDQTTLDNYYLSLEGKTIWITINERRPPRSGDQNRKYWKILEIICDHTGDTPEELHKQFKQELLPRVYTKENGKEIVLRKSTTRLTTKEFTQYLDKVIAMAAQHYGVIIEDIDKPYSKKFMDDCNDILDNTL